MTRLASILAVVFLLPYSGLSLGISRRASANMDSDVPQFTRDLLPSFLASEYVPTGARFSPNLRSLDSDGNGNNVPQFKAKPALRSIYNSPLLNPNLVPSLKRLPTEEDAPAPMAEKVDRTGIVSSMPMIGDMARSMGIERMFPGLI